MDRRDLPNSKRFPGRFLHRPRFVSGKDGYMFNRVWRRTQTEPCRWDRWAGYGNIALPERQE